MDSAHDGPMRAEPTSEKVVAKRRRKGEGSLRCRNGIWYIIYTVGKERIEESTGETSVRKATDLLRERLTEAERDEKGALLPRARSTTLRDLLPLTKAEFRRKKNKSVVRMTRAANRLIAALGDGPIRRLRHAAIAEYVDARLAEGAGQGSVRYEVATLRRMLRLAYRHDLLAVVPAMPVVAEADPRQGFFSREDLESVINYLPPHYAAPLRFSYLTGWRFASEVLTLKWSQVDFNRGEVVLWDGKTKNDEGRAFPFAALPELGEILRTQRKITEAHNAASPGRKCDWVFHADGRRVSSSYNEAWRRARKLAGHDTALVHDLRRTSTRNLSEAGVPDQVAMELQGHKSRQMYDRYRIVSGKDKVAAVRRLALAVAQSLPTKLDAAGDADDTTSGK